MQLLTAKPVFYVANVSEDALGNVDADKHYQALAALARSEGARVIAISAALEAQITLVLQPDATSGQDAALHGLVTEANNN